MVKTLVKNGSDGISHLVKTLLATGSTSHQVKSLVETLLEDGFDDISHFVKTLASFDVLKEDCCKIFLHN